MKWIGRYLIEEYDERRFITRAPLTYVTDEGIDITVPSNFITDGASIPKICWSLIGSPFTGKYKRAALVHDWLYYTFETTRIYADKIFLEIMEERDVPFLKRHAMYRAVRTAGWIPWNRRFKASS